MKHLIKLLCLTLILVSICSLWSCSEPAKEYNVEVKTDHENGKLTFLLEYTDKFKECTANVVGLQTTKVVSDTTEKIEEGRNRKTIVYSLSSGKMTVVLVNFKGVNEKDNVTLAYRAEIVNGYITVRTLEGLQSA